MKIHTSCKYIYSDFRHVYIYSVENIYQCENTFTVIKIHMSWKYIWIEHADRVLKIHMSYKYI